MQEDPDGVPAGQHDVLGAESADRRVERQDEGIPAIVGIELGFPVALRINNKTEAGRPHVVKELLSLVADQPLLFPTQAEIHSEVLAEGPRVVYVSGVILSAALCYPTIKPAAG